MADTQLTASQKLADNVHIIAVCGILAENASPEDDGWFLSDFFMLNQIFEGLGASQAWFTSCSMEDLVKQHGEYAHGNPFHERRIVFSKDVRPHDIIEVHSEHSFQQIFLDALQEKCIAASKANEPILLIILGHGESSDEAGIGVGRYPEPQPLNEEGIALTPYLTRDHIRDIKDNCDDLRITVLTTACFSGSWTVMKPFSKEVAVMAGARTGYDATVAWPLSKSVGRACGFVFMTAMLNALGDFTTSEDTSSGDQGSEGDLEKSYKELHDRTIEQLKLRYKFPDSQISFSARGEKWEEEWSCHSGIPLADFFSKYRTLPKAESTPRDGNAFADMTPDSTLVAWGVRLADHRDISPSLGSVVIRTGGSRGAVILNLQNNCRRYLNSKPGLDNVASNLSFHGKVRSCIRGTIEPRHLEILAMELEYRLEMIRRANTVVEVMNIIPFLPFGEYDQGPVSSAPVYDHQQSRLHMEVMGRLTSAAIFRVTPGYKGQGWYRPKAWVSAVLVMSGLRPTDIEERITLASRTRQLSLKQEKSAVTLTRRKRMRSWITAVGGRVRSLSPRKRSKT